MKLNIPSLSDKTGWEKANVALPAYDVPAVVQASREHPVWVHFGIGNIFRIFIGGIADTLISKGLMDKGITCVETFDYDVVDKIYDPFDNLVLAVTLHADGSTERKILGSLTEAVKADTSDPAAAARLAEIFEEPGLQMVSFTITEKGYALKNSAGEYLAYVLADIEKGPDHATGAMGILTALLLKRFKAGACPIALVSMDNVSKNGKKLRESVLEMGSAWLEKGYVDEAFIAYISDESKVSFPWSMIDKITPRPSDDVCRTLLDDGIEDMSPVVTSRQTYIAPFVNAEGPQYLVVEDSFPNGRPPLEEAGVLMTDRETVNKSERMKVTVCLNPVHTALCTYDVMLGYELFADGMHDPELAKLATLVSRIEGLPVVDDPGIINPSDFLDELMAVRFPNPYLGDTSARIAVDISQMVGIRFGETIKTYVARFGSAKELIGLPLAIAGWIRYLLAVDDQGQPFELSPDPAIPDLKAQLAGLRYGEPESMGDALKPLLKNTNIFGIDLYEAGIGEKIEQMVREMLEGDGAVRRTLKKWL